MARDYYNDVITRLSDRIQRHPRLYKFQVLTLVFLGYSYIFLIIGLLFATLIFFLAVFLTNFNSASLKFILADLFLIFIVLRALWVRFEKPIGFILKKEKAPRLLTLIEEAHKSLKTPKIHRVVINERYNFQVYQRPRLGLFGGYNNYLVIGLPVIAGLSPEQFKAILAHELGHLSRAHGRFNSWVFRIKETWRKLLEKLESKKHWGTFLFFPFFRRYYPYFSQYTLVLERENEKQADEYATQIGGSKQLGAALITMELKRRYLGEVFWPSVYEKAKIQPKPIAGLHHMMFNSLKSELPEEKAVVWLNDELAATTEATDVTPSISDRLHGLGVRPELPKGFGMSAIDFYFEDSLSDIIAEYDELWRDSIIEDWQANHAYLKRGNERMKKLKAKSETNGLDIRESLEFGSLIKEQIGPEEALKWFEQLVQEHDDDINVLYNLGRVLIELDRKEGVTYLEKAMDLNIKAIEPSCEILYEYYMRKGNKVEANKYYRIMYEHSDNMLLADRERSILNIKDSFVSTDLPLEAITRLKNELKHYPLRNAFYVKKETEVFPLIPLYVLGISILRPWYMKILKGKARKFDSQLIQRISDEVEFPGETIVFSFDTNKKIGKIIKKNYASQLF